MHPWVSTSCVIRLFPFHLKSLQLAGMQWHLISLSSAAKCLKGIISRRLYLKSNQLAGTSCTEWYWSFENQCSWNWPSALWYTASPAGIKREGGTWWLKAWSWSAVCPLGSAAEFVYRPLKLSVNRVLTTLTCSLTQRRCAVITTGVLLLLTDWKHLRWRHWCSRQQGLF